MIRLTPWPGRVPVSMTEGRVMLKRPPDSMTAGRSW